MMKRVFLVAVVCLIGSQYAFATSPGWAIGAVGQFYTEEADDFLDMGLGVNISYEMKASERVGIAFWGEYAFAEEGDTVEAISGLDLGDFDLDGMELDYKEYSAGVELRLYPVEPLAFFVGAGAAFHDVEATFAGLDASTDETTGVMRGGVRMSANLIPIFAVLEYRKYTGDGDVFDGINAIVGIHF